MTDRDELDALRAHLDRLEAEIDDLRAERAEEVTGILTNEPPMRAAVGRRQWMKAAAGAAVGGAVVALSGAQPVAADDPNDITLGSTKATTGRTGANFTGPSGGSAFLFQVGTTFSTTSSSYPSAIAGATTDDGQPSGVYGYTNVNADSASGVVGRASGGAAAAAGVRGRHDGFGTAVSGSSANGFGVVGSGTTGVSGNGTDYGVIASGDVAALFFPPAAGTAPPARTDPHDAGEIDIHRLDAVGFESDFWACVGGGIPGRWRKLAGPGTAGSLHPVEPTRVYDSRRPLPGGGTLASGATRTVSVADGRDLSTGAVTVADLVPKGATAIAFNLTITGTVGRGFLSVAPGSSTALGASTINWSESGQNLANGSVVKLDDSRQVKVYSGGPSGSTHFILDVAGYYI
jgi:hypothetical protein